MAFISLVVGYKERPDHLLQAFPSWMQHIEMLKEIIIVDWDSDKSAREVLQEHHLDTKHPKVRIAQVVGAGPWVLSQALNFGIGMATAKWLLKVDADTLLTANFFKDHPLEDKLFYSGNWAAARVPNETHLNGVFLAPRNAVQAVGGYNEFICSYGWDDSDLYERLQTYGLNKQKLCADSLSHIPHDDKLRRPNLPSVDLDIYRNMYLCKMDDYRWNSTRAKTVFKAVGPPGVWTIVQRAPQPTAEDLVIATKKAYSNALAKHGWTWDMTSRCAIDFLASLYQRRQHKKLYIEARNGLGNRLRAIASAMSAAQKWGGYQVVVVWIPDLHCGAKFNDLFDASNLLVTATRPSGLDSLTDETPAASNGSTAHFRTVDGDNRYYASACVLPGSDWTRDSCWLRKNLKLLPRLQKRLDRLAAEFAICSCIGVHIRMGQSAKEYKFEQSHTWETKQQLALIRNRTNSHWTHFLRWMRAEWSKSPTQCFFVAADSQQVYEEMDQHLDPQERMLIKKTLKNKFDRSLEQLETALMDIYLLTRTKKIVGSPWSTFTELVQRLNPDTPVLLSGKHFGLSTEIAIAALRYSDSSNIGDEIQTIASLTALSKFFKCDDEQELLHPQSLVRVPHIWYDRDNHWKATQARNKSGMTKIIGIFNGWFDGRFMTLPEQWPKHLHPLVLSVHLNEDKDEDTELYRQLKIVHLGKKSLLDHKPGHPWTKTSSTKGVGCRDEATLDKLRAAQIKAYHCSCLTLYLEPSLLFHPSILEQPRSGIVIVDAHLKEPALLQQLVPEGIRMHHSTSYLSHDIGAAQKNNHNQKLETAFQRLMQYARAGLVITCRLHAALPSLALGTPVLFLYSKIEADCRFGPTFVELLGDGRGQGQALPRIDWQRWKETAVITARQQQMLTDIKNGFEWVLADYALRVGPQESSILPRTGLCL